MTMNRNSIIWAACCSAAALAGCGTAPPNLPDALQWPAGWQQAEFGAPVTAGSDWADPQLLALQKQALAANRDLARAALRWQQAQNLVAQGELRLQPGLGANASLGRPLEPSPSRTVQIDGVSVPVSTAAGWSRSHGASASAGFEWDLWGRLAHATAAQVAQADAARTDIGAARALLLAQVAERYWSAAAALAQQPAVREQERLAQEILQLTTLRVREGKLLPIEIDKASATLIADQVRLIDLAADAQLQRHQLALLLGAPLPGPELEGAKLPPGEPPLWALAAPAEVLARRPDVQRARLDVDAALARLKAAQADRYPRLSFSASVGTGGTEARDWLSQPFLSLASNLLVPMVDWRRLDLQRDSAHTEVELAALSLREVVGKSLAEVEAQGIERQRLQQQASALQARLKDLREAERVAEAKFAAGAMARLDFLQARRARLAGEQEAQQLQLRRWVNHAAMFRVLGLDMGAWAGP